MTRHGSILVIDDEEIMREILETLLVREGYQVRLATNVIGCRPSELTIGMPMRVVYQDYPEKNLTLAYFTPSNSTSNTNVALGGITPPAPRAP